LLGEAEEKLAAAFRPPPYKQITVLQGDSGNVITRVMQEVFQPVLFWLDAHYSGGITARGELDSPIFDSHTPAPALAANLNRQPI
jgi:hypothetical protein